MNPSSNEFRLCNSDEWRSGNHGGSIIIRGYGGGGDMVVRHGLNGCLDHRIIRFSPILPPLQDHMIVIDTSCEICNSQKYLGGSGYQQKDRKPSQNDKTEHGMEKTVQNQDQMGPQSFTTAHLCAIDKDCEDFEGPTLAQLQPISAIVHTNPLHNLIGLEKAQ
ncbi:hypothetical protein Tco_0924888 [Tanacetum coccineum]|uniref:Uncharacterized protein n=1 Tax=Tanacetum coccineum TaxID=301880 RepID=A0ABQ5DBH4_9ASTR